PSYMVLSFDSVQHRLRPIRDPGPFLSPRRTLRPLAPVSLDILQTPAYETSGLTFVPTSTLESWEFRLKDFAGLDNHEEGSVRETATSTFALDDFDVQTEDSILQPMLTSPDTIPAA